MFLNLKNETQDRRKGTLKIRIVLKCQSRQPQLAFHPANIAYDKNRMHLE